MFETTLAGSLPKPSWLATPNVLWAPWTLTGAPLQDAKEDATALAIKRQEDAGIRQGDAAEQVEPINPGTRATQIAHEDAEPGHGKHARVTARAAVICQVQVYARHLDHD